MTPSLYGHPRDPAPVVAEKRRARIGEYFSVRVPVIAILFILVGGAIILKPLVERRT